jgi:hypothetical protein
MVSNSIDDDIFSIYFSGLHFNVEKQKEKSMLKTLTYLSTKVKIQKPWKIDDSSSLVF